MCRDQYCAQNSTVTKVVEREYAPMEGPTKSTTTKKCRYAKGGQREFGIQNYDNQSNLQWEINASDWSCVQNVRKLELVFVFIM